jgi:hypothetical protein
VGPYLPPPRKCSKHHVTIIALAEGDEEECRYCGASVLESGRISTRQHDLADLPAASHRARALSGRPDSNLP